jgi:hypothetical protein
LEVEEVLEEALEEEGPRYLMTLGVLNTCEATRRASGPWAE